MESSQLATARDVPVTCTEEQLHRLQEQQQQGEEQRRGQGGGAREKECVHRTKFIQFLGRTTPVVLPNDNGLSLLSVPHCDLRKGGLEEEAELMRALRLSEAEMLSSMGDSGPVGHACGTSVSAAYTTEKVSLTNTAGTLQYCDNESPSDTISGPASAGTAVATSCTLIPEIVVTSEDLQPGGVSPSFDLSNLADQRTVNAIGAISISVTQQYNHMSEELDRVSHKSEMFEKPPLSLHSPGEATDCRHDTENVSSFSAHPPPSFSGGGSDTMPELCAPVIDGSEPIYAGKEHILDSGTSYEDKEPIYKGEIVLAKQSDNHSGGNPEVGAEDKVILSKYEGELYLLATDQGYHNQPDLIHSVPSNFKEFKMESPSSETWDESNAMASTTDYLASVDGATHAGLDMNSDLQLAIALQQEFEQQQQQQQQQRNNVQQSSLGGSKLVTGPPGGTICWEEPSIIQ